MYKVLSKAAINRGFIFFEQFVGYSFKLTVPCNTFKILIVHFVLDEIYLILYTKYQIPAIKRTLTSR